ncbi:hypothetical protein J5N97_007425 [Dioscorea zingiberensis]|uniref:Uncharacterized protein n=1 Tax=Dioscorea zingiberensis TaxID=325984 RepID=A0A9D5DCL6_9LILI|nr:hypothetical protein J5N97_007425 [Dioscorea zingiberensis]
MDVETISGRIRVDLDLIRPGPLTPPGSDDLIPISREFFSRRPRLRAGTLAAAGTSRHPRRISRLPPWIPSLLVELVFCQGI